MSLTRINKFVEEKKNMTQQLEVEFSTSIVYLMEESIYNQWNLAFS